MRNLVVNILISFFLLNNCNPVLAYDFAPEIGDSAPNFKLDGFNKNIKISTKSLKSIQKVGLDKFAKSNGVDLKKF